MVEGRRKGPRGFCTSPIANPKFDIAMDNSGQPEKAISVRSRLKSLKSVQSPALEDETSQHERLQPTDEDVDKP